MDERRNLSIDGYRFYNEADTEAASLEQRKIEYMEARMDYSNPESILKVYNRSIEERLFKTPVGFEFLKRLQEFLKSQEGILAEQISDIPLYVTFATEVRRTTNPVRNRIKPAEEKDKGRQFLVVSVILNILLVIAICAMFSISIGSDKPNILNYERVITDKYASWEQELTDREQALRERELQLKRTEGDNSTGQFTE